MQVQENNAAQGQNDAANNGGGRGRNIDTMDTDALRRYAKELRRDKGRMGGLIRRLELQGGIRQIQPTPVERRVPCHEPSVYDVKEFLKAFDSHLREKDATMLERATKMQRVTETPMITDMAEDGDELDEALKAIDTTAKEMKERAGEVECVICLQALAPGLVFKPAWCTHVTCISCIETYKTHKGVLVPCPMHCEGNSCSPEYWTKHSKALGEIQAEALVASASTNQNNDESDVDKVDRWVREGRIKILRTADGRHEIASDGPAANKRVAGSDEKINIYRAKDTLKMLPNRFHWDREGDVCGVPKSWYRVVAA